MMDSEFDYENFLTIRQLLEQGTAFTEGTLRRWLFNRHKNGLACATVIFNRAVLIDVLKFNLWLSNCKKTLIDFRFLRTKNQIIKAPWLTMGKLENWLRHRHSNGLDQAVINKNTKLLYIDIRLFNRWLMEFNMNPAFGVPDLIDI